MRVASELSLRQLFTAALSPAWLTTGGAAQCYSSYGRMADINDFGFYTMVYGLADRPVRIRDIATLSDDLLFVRYADENGAEGCDFISASFAATLTVR